MSHDLPFHTPLYDNHVQAHAKMADFAGWEMPIFYRSVIEEHVATRTNGALFDVSHMGRIRISGRDGAKLLSQATSRDVGTMEVGECRYALVCNNRGGVLDDVIILHNDQYWMVVVNASNRGKILAHLHSLSGGLKANISDQTIRAAMIAVQGPKVAAIMKRLLPFELVDLRPYHFLTDSYMFMEFTISRTGYTGEDGFEAIMPAKAASMAWDYLRKSVEGFEPLQEAGLAARDTLRLEAGMPLYGHELSEDIDPITAGLGWAVHLDHDFVGRDALARIVETGPVRKRVGLIIDSKRIARAECEVIADDRTVGEITSGTLSPTLSQSIAMAFVDTEYSPAGTQLCIRSGKAMLPATVTPLPFYSRAGK